VQKRFFRLERSGIAGCESARRTVGLTQFNPFSRGRTLTPTHNNERRAEPQVLGMYSSNLQDIFSLTSGVEVKQKITQNRTIAD